MIIQSVHYIDKNNTGDMMSCPLEHFKINAEIRKLHIYDIDKLNIDLPVIIGGGGLLQQGNSSKNIEKIINNNKAPVIIWGIGFNTNYKKKDDYVPDFINNASLCGIRDYGLDGIKYVPCASCMHGSFMNEYEIKNEVVCFEGNKLGLSIPTMGCGSGANMNEIIKFLGSAKTIITSSYHGMYWGALLKKEVIVIPNADSSKFFYFPVKLPHATINNWRSFLGTGNKYNILNEFRSINIDFAKNVSDLLNIEFNEK